VFRSFIVIRSILHCSGQLEAEFLANAAHLAGIEILTRADERQFRSSSFAVDRHSPMTFSALFTLRIEVAPMFGQPLPERCNFHRTFAIFALTRQSSQRSPNGRWLLPSE